MSNLLTVFGATGIQGGSVIKSVLAHPSLSQQFKIRGITRDTSKTSSKELEEKGVEMVQADSNDLKSLFAAVAGSHTVYAVTNFWDSKSKHTEITQGKNIADACDEVGGIQHVIWSSLVNCSEISAGKYNNVEHFDSKAEVDSYMRTLKLSVTTFLPGFYMSNIPQALRKCDGKYFFSQPYPITTKIPFFDAQNDTGKFVCGIMTHKDKLLSTPDGGRVFGATGYYSMQELMETLEKVDNTSSFTYCDVNPETFKSYLPAEIADEMVEMLLFIEEFSYYGNPATSQLDLDESLTLLDSPPTTLEEYIRNSKLIELIK